MIRLGNILICNKSVKLLSFFVKTLSHLYASRAIEKKKYTFRFVATAVDETKEFIGACVHLRLQNGSAGGEVYREIVQVCTLLYRFTEKV